MTCRELAAAVERLQPGLSPRDVARVCLLIANYVDDLDAIDGDEALLNTWHQMSVRLEAATDQHAAMTEELESLASKDPREMGMADIAVLIRALKVQSQVLQMYVGTAVPQET
ncbi:MAG: hypothetical protein D6741_05280 [Planctomycetota bacterium]|nr:MAG: hypothetical protein D6741_05280 [Planctomycetota bacterium]